MDWIYFNMMMLEITAVCVGKLSSISINYSLKESDAVKLPIALFNVAKHCEHKSP